MSTDQSKLKKIKKLCIQMQSCWFHHQDGSDLRGGKYISKLFDIVFNRLPQTLGYKDIIDFEEKTKKEKNNE